MILKNYKKKKILTNKFFYFFIFLINIAYEILI